MILYQPIAPETYSPAPESLALDTTTDAWIRRLLAAQPPAHVPPAIRAGWSKSIVPWQSHPVVPLGAL